jgi:predicted nuclease with TOPRIM domain
MNRSPWARVTNVLRLQKEIARLEEEVQRAQQQVQALTARVAEIEGEK